MAKAAVYHHQARVVTLSRDRSPNDPENRYAPLENYVTRVVADSPPLTVAQVDRITAILRLTLRGGVA